MNLFSLLNIPTNMSPTPSTFNEGFSYYETVSKLMTLVNQMIQQVNDNTNEEMTLKSKYDDFVTYLNSLQHELNSFKEGNTIPDGSLHMQKMAGDFLEYLEGFIADSVHKQAKFISFGLDDDGHLFADIPNSWNEIVFSTDGSGNLVLEY